MKFELELENARKTAVGLRRFRNCRASLPMERPPTRPCPRLKFWHCAYLPTVSSTAKAAPTPFHSTLPLREPVALDEGTPPARGVARHRVAGEKAVRVTSHAGVAKVGLISSSHFMTEKKLVGICPRVAKHTGLRPEDLLGNGRLTTRSSGRGPWWAASGRGNAVVAAAQLGRYAA